MKIVNRLPLVITGGIASGKSTVGRLFSDLGFRVVDADKIGYEVFESLEVQSWLKQKFGDEGDYRRLVRDRLGDAQFRSSFNSITHPLILNSIIHSGAHLVEIPLVVEACLVSRFGPVVACDCSLEVSQTRLLARLGDKSLVKHLIASQVNPDVRKVFADYVIRTDLDIDSVSDMVKTIAKISL